MKRQADRRQKKIEKWKKSDKVINTESLVYKEKLTERYVRSCIVEKVVLANTAKTKLPVLMRIHLIVNVSKVVRYKKLVKRQKVKELKLVKIYEEEE